MMMMLIVSPDVRLGIVGLAELLSAASAERSLAAFLQICSR